MSSFNDSGKPQIVFTDGTRCSIPHVAGSSMDVDLAFASMQENSAVDAGSEIDTNFFMPLSCPRPGLPPAHRLANAKTVKFGELKFSHFLGASRH